jgi:hypothetical protein
MSLRGQVEIEDGGFPKYPESGTGAKKAIAKWNAQRTAESLVQIQKAPILDKASVLFETGEHWQYRPCSCYTCERLNLKAGTCRIHGPRIKTVRFICEGIEYWPDCGKAEFGEPNKGEATYVKFPDDPDYTGLCWINAPEVGLEFSGANCGGAHQGDDCDYFDTNGRTAKWDASIGMCRVLKTEVANDDRCAAWDDDDVLDWKKGQQLIEKHGRSDNESVGQK